MADWWDLDVNPMDWLNSLARKYTGDKFFPKERYLKARNAWTDSMVNIVNQMNRNAPTLESLGEGPSFALQPAPTTRFDLQTRENTYPEVSGGVTLPFLGHGVNLNAEYQHNPNPNARYLKMLFGVSDEF